MNQINYVRLKNLQLGDKLVRRKDAFFQHYGIYLGVHEGLPLVAENQRGCGIQGVSIYDFLLGDSSNLLRIEPFKGTEIERSNVIPRIRTLLGTEYNLVNFNCEHFATYAQTGEAKSSQVTNAFTCLALLGFIFLASND